MLNTDDRTSLLSKLTPEERERAALALVDRALQREIEKYPDLRHLERFDGWVPSVLLSGD